MGYKCNRIPENQIALISAIKRDRKYLLLQDWEICLFCRLSRYVIVMDFPNPVTDIAIP